MKKINLLIALALSLGIASCNNGSDKTATAETKDTANTTAAAPIKTSPTLPMDVLIIYHTVKDYNQWKQGFDADSVARLASGLSFIALEKSADKPNDVKIVFAVSDLGKAKSFIADPRLEEAMGKAGVISKPVTNFWSIIRNNKENQKAGDTRVEIIHKVKDFGVWVKGFDAEGPATRAANGMNDMVLGRGLEDSNMVHVVFDVTDLAKAKARLANPALKKIMEEAGVIGVPSIKIYIDASK
ncbi:MAG: hypothetical protein WCG67_06030 [Ferruginibacter sp.]